MLSRKRFCVKVSASFWGKMRYRSCTRKSKHRYQTEDEEARAGICIAVNSSAIIHERKTVHGSQTCALSLGSKRKNPSWCERPRRCRACNTWSEVEIRFDREEVG